MSKPVDSQYSRLTDEEANCSAQRHLVSSEQALQAARAGCDVRAERWTTNPGWRGHAPLFDRPARITPRSHPRAATYSRRTLPIGSHPINDLTRPQAHRLATSRAQPAAPASPSRPPPVMVPYTPVDSLSADVPLLPPDVPRHASSEELGAARGRAAAAAGRFALASARAVQEQEQAQAEVEAGGRLASSGNAFGLQSGLRRHTLSELEKGGADAVRAVMSASWTCTLYINPLKPLHIG